MGGRGDLCVDVGAYRYVDGRHTLVQVGAWGGGGGEGERGDVGGRGMALGLGALGVALGGGGVAGWRETQEDGEGGEGEAGGPSPDSANSLARHAYMECDVGV